MLVNHLADHVIIISDLHKLADHNKRYIAGESV